MFLQIGLYRTTVERVQSLLLRDDSMDKSANRSVLASTVPSKTQNKARTRDFLAEVDHPPPWWVFLIIFEIYLMGLW